MRSTAGSALSARLAALATALVLALVTPAAYAQFRMAVVDIRRAIAETAEGRAATDAVKGRFDQRQAELNRRSAAVEALKTQLESPAARLQPAKSQKMMQDYYQKAGELQELGQRYTEEIQYLQGVLSQRILEKMQPVLREVGQTDNIQLVMDQAAVLYSRGDLDFTDRVIQLYNQRNPWTPGTPVQLPEVPAQAARPAGPGAPTPPVPPAAAMLPPSGAPAAPSTPETAPAPPSGADGGAPRSALPGVFYRRDAGR